MTYSAKILADSIARDVRLTTMEVCFPRFILAEFNTHRVLSRNSASSRAIPVEKRIEQVRANPFVPEAFTKNKRGMQADEGVDAHGQSDARDAWLRASEWACREAEFLAGLGVHKQHANRLLEPFCWHTVVVSATDWDNFFALRTHKAAQPEMQIIAKMMKEAYDRSEPRELRPVEWRSAWHLPYVGEQDIREIYDWHNAVGDRPPEQVALATSVVRCAAVSYERQHADRTVHDIIARHDALAAAGHWSPFEHQAKVAGEELPRPGNFRPPWTQYRKTFEGEAVFSGDNE